jgi:phosphate transport system substrate-binding protein
VGVAGAQNAGVCEVVKLTPYSIGYVDLSYALRNRVPANRVRNRAGVFIEPTLSSLTAAAMAAETPSDFRTSLVDASSLAAYPIASYTWFIVPSRLNESAKKHALFEFLSWMLAAGQTYAAPNGYAPLPKEIIAREQRQLSFVH